MSTEQTIECEFCPTKIPEPEAQYFEDTGYVCPKCIKQAEEDHHARTATPPIEPGTDTPFYQLIQDRDCHWYVIPVGLNHSFYCWLDANEKEDGCADDPHEFYKMRVDGPHTVEFAQWKEAK